MEPVKIMPQEMPSFEAESPTSVAVVMDSTWKSTIISTDCGAEVTLDEHEARRDVTVATTNRPVVTPTKNGHGPRKQLDDDPSMLQDSQVVEIPGKTRPLSFAFMSCMPSTLDDSPTVVKEFSPNRELVGCTSNLLYSLGPSNAGNFGWHQRLLPSMADDLDEIENTCPSPHRVRVMHNRTLHTHSKNDRLEQLKRNHQPFQSHRATQQPLARVNTYSCAPRKISEPDPIERIPTPQKLDWTCHPRLESDYSRVVEVNENECYDSDPECYNETKSRSTLASPLRDGVGLNQNEDNMHAAIQEIFRERWTFILHPERGSPMGVDAWMKRGQRLPRATVAPKLVWLPVHSKTSEKELARQESKLAGIEILDMQRILPMGRIDRKKYAFARPRRSVLIKSQNGDFCFECRSMAERDKFIHQMKLAVARFGSQLVANDPRVSDFFIPQDGNVGRPPF